MHVSARQAVSMPEEYPSVIAIEITVNLLPSTKVTRVFLVLLPFLMSNSSFLIVRLSSLDRVSSTARTIAVSFGFRGGETNSPEIRNYNFYK